MSADLCWYHSILTTYGAWLHGDPRGFRTRHHREHVEGDYKNTPPPGQYDHLARRSQKLLQQPPVVLPPEWRPVVGLALKEKLEQLGALLVCLSAGGQHFHILAKMPEGEARAWLGLAKKHTTFLLHARGWTGLLWGKRSKSIPVRDRPHQLNVYHYILDHADEGAWVWTMLQRK